MLTNRMKRLKRSILVITLVLGIFTSLVSAAPATTRKPVPFKGQSSGLVTTVGFDPVALIAYTHAEGAGQATHLGNFTTSGYVAINFIPGTVLGTFTLTAANGDMLFLTMEGGGIDPTHGVGNFTIVGGTGRFQGATGSYHQEITFAAPGGSAEVIAYTEVFEGIISLELP